MKNTRDYIVLLNCSSYGRVNSSTCHFQMFEYILTAARRIFRILTSTVERIARNYAETVPFHKISTPGNRWNYGVYFSQCVLSLSLSIEQCRNSSHCVKSLRIQSFSDPYFPRHVVSLRTQSECRKIRTRKTSNTDTFYEVSVRQIIS